MTPPSLSNHLTAIYILKSTGLILIVQFIESNELELFQ